MWKLQLGDEILPTETYIKMITFKRVTPNLDRLTFKLYNDLMKVVAEKRSQCATPFVHEILMSENFHGISNK